VLSSSVRCTHGRVKGARALALEILYTQKIQSAGCAGKDETLVHIVNACSQLAGNLVNLYKAGYNNVLAAALRRSIC